MNPVQCSCLNISVLKVTQYELSISTAGLLHYRFGIQASPHKEVAILPQAGKFLINPNQLTVFVADDCQLESVIFTATRGPFVTGSVSPALQGVEVTVVSPQLPKPVKLLTDETGVYSEGPSPGTSSTQSRLRSWAMSSLMLRE